MFVIRRRVDGKYWRNDKRGVWRRNDDGVWVADLQDVKPFRTKAAAKTSLPSNKNFWDWSRARYHAARDGNPPIPDCCKAVKHSYRGVTNKCSHVKAAEQADHDWWDANYELMPVKLSLVED